jgi:hypothetical protein
MFQHVPPACPAMKKNPAESDGIKLALTKSRRLSGCRFC